MPDLHRHPMCATVADDEQRPVVVVAEEGTLRDLEHVVVFPQNEPGHYAVPGAELILNRRGYLEVGCHLHALFLDAEGRHLRLPVWHHRPHPSVERLVSAPAHDLDGDPLRHPHCVGGEHIDHYFEGVRVAHPDEWRARLHDPGTFLVDL